MEEKTVYHIDVNSAYLSWEAVYRLKFLGARTDLRRIPSAIGGDISQRNYPGKVHPCEKIQGPYRRTRPPGKAEMSRSSDRAAQLWPV